MGEVTLPGSTATAAALERLEQALATGVPCAPVRDLIGSDDIAAAYEIQSVLISQRIAAGAIRVGRKIGLTSPSVQQQLGVDQPDFGVLLDDMQIADHGSVPVRRLLQPKVEGEIAFVLGADLAGELSLDAVRAAVSSAHAAIEIVDSRIAGWNIRIADTVADNASSGLFVVSPAGLGLDQFEPVSATMSLTVNGIERSSGDGSACLGDPLLALLWLARAAAQYGDPLRAGDLVLSGALGPMVAVEPGDQVRVQISGLGTADVSFDKGE